ncbi:MAG: HlyD family efflux transporter periplasmic adaptor subunit [Clostridia bacterium]|nr:HlyD family efflux transporter periplasmic adaptor subunit [Clostridia bacterium]
MKKLMSCLILTALTLTLLLPAALADSVTVSGKVVSTESEIVTAPIGGTVSKIIQTAGTHVSAGDPLVTLDTTVVYAQESGVVRIFGAPGDQTESVAERYGAVAYVEPDYSYTISVSTKYAYDDENNRVIHPGESVYLKGYTDVKHTGRGIVTQVSGSTFTVEITSGSFSSGESVNVFRDSAYTAASRLGRGSVAHTDPKAYTGEGSIVRFAVENGASVKKGDALFETLTGEFDFLNMTGNQITATASGIIASVSVAPGTAIEKGASTVEIYPDSAMRIEASVSEASLRYLSVGSKVTVEFPYLRDDTVTVSGTVERISFLADGTNPDATEEDAGSTDEAYYLVYVAFNPVDEIRYGMSAVITSEN